MIPETKIKHSLIGKLLISASYHKIYGTYGTTFEFGNILKQVLNNKFQLCSTISHGNSAEEIWKFINVNNAVWSNFIKERKDRFYKYTRYDQLLNLYNYCLAEELMNITKVLARNNLHDKPWKKMYGKFNLEKPKNWYKNLNSKKGSF